MSAYTDPVGQAKAIAAVRAREILRPHVYPRPRAGRESDALRAYLDANAAGLPGTEIEEIGRLLAVLEAD